MPAVEIEDLACLDCGQRGVLIADQFGQCTDCASRNVKRWEDMTDEEKEAVENM